MKKCLVMVFLLWSVSLQAAQPNIQGSSDLRDELSADLTKIYQANKGHLPASDDSARPDPNLIVFVSLSMPRSSLKAIIAQAARINAAVVIRGVLPTGLKPTIQFISALLVEDKDKISMVKGGISIAPSRFKQFHIAKVPTYVLLDNGKCVFSKFPCESENFEQLEGNITPLSALKVFSNKGTHQELAGAILTAYNDDRSQN